MAAHIKNARMKSSHEILVAEIDAFLKRAKFSDTRFGELVMNDRHLMRRLRSGSDIKLSTVDNIREFMSSYAVHEDVVEDDRRAKRKPAKRRRKSDNKRISVN